MKTVQNENGNVHLLTFKLDDQEYALEIAHVVQVTRMIALTPSPQTSDCVEGMFNLRGKLIPVVNIRKLFGLSSKEFDLNTQLLVAQSEGHTLALAVDTVSEVLTIPVSSIEPPTQIGIHDKCLSAVGKLGSRLIMILDPNTFLKDGSSF